MKNKSLRHTLIVFAIAFSTISAVFYTVLIMSFTDKSLTKVFDSILLVEARSFERDYQNNVDTPLRGSSTVSFYLDSWQGAPEYLKQLPAIEQMTVGEIYELDIPKDDSLIIEYSEQATDANSTDELDEIDVEIDIEYVERIISAYCHLLPDGRKLVVVSDVEVSMLTDSELRIFDELFNNFLLTNLGYSIFSLLLMLIALRHMFKQTNILTVWVEYLTIEKLSNVTPKLAYSEFSLIAEKLRQSMQKISDMAKKEQRFLQNISHELRTPIAVSNANLSLLQRIPLPEQAHTPLTRLKRANKNMQLMTETLLWVNRESSSAPQTQLTDPCQLIQEQLDIHHYLLQDKEVTLSIRSEADTKLIELPQSALEIVSGNLIRNAFQHTEQGEIKIHITRNHLSIANQYQEGYQGEQESFGLGINLVKQICDKLHWSFAVEKSEQGFNVKLDFS